MTFEEHKKAVEGTFKVYDTIDFVPFMKECDTLDDLRELMDEKFSGSDITKNEFMHGCFFNVISDGRLIEYLKGRYGNKFACEAYTVYGIRYYED